jgi:hypothetical protein
MIDLPDSRSSIKPGDKHARTKASSAQKLCRIAQVSCCLVLDRLRDDTFSNQQLLPESTLSDKPQCFIKLYIL